MNPSHGKEEALAPGSLVPELLITDMTVEGKAVARHQGRVFFLDQGLPGARVSAKVASVKKGVVHADVVRELQPSPHAVAPWCPHVDDCGACLWQHFSLDAAMEWKRKHVTESLARIGRLADIPVEPLLPSPKSRAFRNKMSYAFGISPEGNTVLGLRRLRDHAVVEVTACGLQHPVAMEILDFVRAAAAQLGLRARQRLAPSKSGTKPGWSGYLRYLLIHTPDMQIDGRSQVIVECITGPEHGRRPANAGEGKLANADAVQSLGQALIERFGLTGFVHSERRAPSDLAAGERTILTLGSDTFQERFGHLLLRVPHNAFLQTNTAMAAQLYECVAQEAALTGQERLWDLYSGIGAIGLFLARDAAEVHGFEVQNDAVKAARANAAALGYAHCRFHAGDVGEGLKRHLPEPDVLVVDPPRAGLTSPAINFLLATRARKLLYVSCNAATQARDAALLSEKWKAVRSRPFDMFPYTPHVENLLVFERGKE